MTKCYKKSIITMVSFDAWCEISSTQINTFATVIMYSSSNILADEHSVPGSDSWHLYNLHDIALGVNWSLSYY